MQRHYFGRSILIFLVEPFYAFLPCIERSISCADLLSAVRKAVEDQKLPLNVAEGMEELYHNYRNAVK